METERCGWSGCRGTLIDSTETWTLGLMSPRYIHIVMRGQLHHCVNVHEFVELVWLYRAIGENLGRKSSTCSF